MAGPTATHDGWVKRLFVAIELPPDVRERLLMLCSGLRGARWVRDGQFHVTLRFLGELDRRAALAVEQALHGVRCDPFELAVSGLGHFPPRGTPRVVWAGVEPQDELRHLHDRVDRVLRRSGQAPEGRKFAPHITLARLKGTPLGQVLGFLEGHGGLRCEPFPVADFQLFSSRLSSSGSLYTVEASYPLFAG